MIELNLRLGARTNPDDPLRRRHHQHLRAVRGGSGGAARPRGGAARPAGRRSDARRRALRAAHRPLSRLMASDAPRPPSFFQRFLLPGLAFKAVVIGGGYATGRELAEFFIPSGPWGGIAAMLLAMAAVQPGLHRHLPVRAGDRDPRLSELLQGSCSAPAGSPFEAVYLLFVVLILAVYGAAAGAIGDGGVRRCRRSPARSRWRPGSSCSLRSATVRSSDCSNMSPTCSTAVYALFIVLAFTSFGDRIAAGFALDAPPTGWAIGGITYFELQHHRRGRDPAGGPPPDQQPRRGDRRGACAARSRCCRPCSSSPRWSPYYPEVGARPLPSDFLLQRMNLPLFHLAFQLMIFSALLESGDQRGPCDQRADRQGLAAPPRRAAHPSRAPGHRPGAAGLLHAASPAASASST